MSVYDELKKSVNRIAELEQELKVSEDVREQRRDELVVLSEKYEAEKYKAEARSRTIGTLQDSLRGVESAYSSDSELWQSTKYSMEATIHELKTQLDLALGERDELLYVLRVLNTRIAFIGMPQEPTWHAEGTEQEYPDWRKEIQMIQESLKGHEEE